MLGIAVVIADTENLNLGDEGTEGRTFLGEGVSGISEDESGRTIGSGRTELDCSDFTGCSK